MVLLERWYVWMDWLRDWLEFLCLFVNRVALLILMDCFVVCLPSRFYLL